MAERLKAPERENRELRQVNGIFRKASASIMSLEPMASFIGAHRGLHGGEPICSVLPIALPSTTAIHHRGPWCGFDAVEFAMLEWGTGSVTAACRSPSGTSRPPRPRQTSTPHGKPSPWPRN